MKNIKTFDSVMAISQFNEDGSVWIILADRTLKFRNVSSAVNYSRDNQINVKF